MSSDAIYIESVIVKITSRSSTVFGRVTDFEAIDDQNENDDPKRRTYQGTLAPSQYWSLGKFDDLIAMVAQRKGLNPEQLKSSGDEISVEITIIADYAAEDLLVGARRAFRAEWQRDHWNLSEATPETQQIRSRTERKRIGQLLASIE